MNIIYYIKMNYYEHIIGVMIAIPEKDVMVYHYLWICYYYYMRKALAKALPCFPYVYEFS